MDQRTVQTAVLRVNRDAPEAGVISEAAAILDAGGIVAIPTETVYGLAARALDEEAVARIFEAKGRPPTNPLIVHVSGAEDAREVVLDWPEVADRLAARFWPGPLTLILPRRMEIPAILTAGLDTVGVRSPAHNVARAVIRAVGVLAAPSANRSTGISPTTAAHVSASLGGRIPLILDAGPTEMGIESTVLSLVGARPVILRPGSISRTVLCEVLGEVDVAEELSNPSGAQLSPGTTARHYAPRAEVVLVNRGDALALESAMLEAESPGCLVHTMDPPPATVCRRLPDDPTAYARELYSALHALDERCDRIIIECVPDTEDWRAIRDRLRRAGR